MIDGYNYVYVHTPKCGGTWVSTVLRQLCDGRHDHKKHAYFGEDLGVTTEEVPQVQKKDDRFTFTFIRHPLGFYQSYYRQKKALGWKRPFQVLSICYLGYVLENPSFEDWLTTVLEEEEDYASRVYRQFTGGCNFIGTQENLVKDFSHVLDLIGHHSKIEQVKQWPRLNSYSDNPHFNGLSQCSERLKKRVEEVDAEGLELWKQATRQSQPSSTVTKVTSSTSLGPSTAS